MPRPKKNKNLKLLEGTYRADRNTENIITLSGIPDPTPGRLKDDEISCYIQLCEQLKSAGCLTASASHIAEDLAVWRGIQSELETDYQVSGPVDPDKPKLFDQLCKAQIRIDKLGGELQKIILQFGNSEQAQKLKQFYQKGY